GRHPVGPAPRKALRAYRHRCCSLLAPKPEGGAMQPTESIRWYATKRKAMRLGRRLLDQFGRELAEHSPLGDRPLYDATQFPWIRQLEAQWQAMRRELDAVLDARECVPNFQDISPDQAHLTRGDQWKTYFFYAFGHRAEA